MNCDYCYLSESSRRENSKISADTLSNIFNKTLTHFLVRDELKILWHAGEPLAAGIRFYEQAVELAEKANIYGHKLTFGFQTNATLINDKWCAFIKEHQFDVGVSLDGPAYLHDKNRKTWDQKGTHAQTMKGVDALKRHGIPFGVICVLTNKHLDYPDEIFHFFREHSIHNVGFNLEEIENAHQGSSLLSSGKLNEEQILKYQRFMERIFDLSIEYHQPIKFREIDRISHHIFKLKHQPNFVPVSDSTLPILNMTFKSNGDFSTFAPELAGGTSEDPDKFKIGNIHDVEDLDDVFSHPTYKRMRDDIKLGVNKCKAECQYYSVCGSQFTSNKFYENGRLDSTETMVCKLSMKTLTNIILNKLQTLGNDPNFDQETYIKKCQAKPAEFLSIA